MYQPGSILSLERSGKSAHRLHDLDLDYAIDMASQSQSSPESFAERRFSSRYIVCHPSSPFSPRNSLMKTASACVASIVRVVTFNEVNFNDITYTIVDASMWSTIEQSVGIICACLLTYQPLFRWFWNRFSSKTRGYSDDSRRTPSKRIQMLHLASKSASKTSGDANNAGFSRLDEENGLESSITTHVTTAPSTRPPASQDRIVRDQAFEQHHEYIN